LIVPRFRHSAVARNQLKRRLRELSRIRLIPSDVAADVVIRIRPDAYRAAFADLGLDIDRALVQLVRWRATVPDVTMSARGEAQASQSSDT
jgi:ribonuclease P protein component